MGRVFDKLKARIKNDLGYECSDFTRTYAGPWQKASGAWLWYARIEGRFDIGSCERATVLVSRKEPLETIDYGGGIEIC